VAKAKRPPQTKKKLGGPRVGEDGPRQAKADAVADVQQRLQGSSAVVLTEYRGMTVHELADLRRSLREAGADYKVYKNTLATIAARNAGLAELEPSLQGPTAFAFTEGDPVVVAKRLADFAKRVPTLILKGGVLEGRVLSSGEIGALSTLDSREVMLAKAAGMLLSPIQKLANLFAAPLNQLGSLLAQLRDKLPAEQPSAPAAAEAPVPEGGEAAAAPVEEARSVEATPEASAPAEVQADEPGTEQATAEAAAEAAPAAEESVAEASVPESAPAPEPAPVAEAAPDEPAAEEQSTNEQQSE
jgi:large subunit ribosomal protein L10